MQPSTYPLSLFSGIFVVLVAIVYATCVVVCRRQRERQHEVELARGVARDNAQNFAAMLNAVPSFKYTAPRRRDDEEAPEAVPECVICLSKVVEGETVKVLPNCVHMFHVDCIDKWLFAHETCPLCRSPVAPTAVAPVTS